MSFTRVPAGDIAYSFAATASLVLIPVQRSRNQLGRVDAAQVNTAKIALYDPIILSRPIPPSSRHYSAYQLDFPLP